MLSVLPRSLLGLGLALLIPSSSRAQDRGGWSASKYRPTVHVFGGFFADAARVAGEITPNVFAVLNVGGLLAREPGEDTEGIAAHANIAAGLSFLDHFAFAIELPALIVTTGRFSTDGETNTDVRLGDARASLEYAFFEAGFDGIGLAVGLDATAIMPPPSPSTSRSMA